MSGRILVAGIGNIFLGDDGFGCEVVRRLVKRELPENVEVRDFGIRGMDLAYALMDPYEAVVFVDAVPRGDEPGTVYLIEAEVPEEGEVALDTHGMDPVNVIRLARVLGAEIPRTLVVGCEPQNIPGRRGGSDPPSSDRPLRRHANGVKQTGTKGCRRSREAGSVGRGGRQRPIAQQLPET